jgi:hypothetical protein
MGYNGNGINKQTVVSGGAAGGGLGASLCRIKSKKPSKARAVGNLNLMPIYTEHNNTMRTMTEQSVFQCPNQIPS